MRLSVILPIYNEEKNILVLYPRLKKVLNNITKAHEIIFICDGCTDNSLQIIRNIRKKDKKVKYLLFSRNFGHMSAITAGLKYSTGAKVVVMDSDLQDPPEVIKKLYNKSKSFEVVFAIKIKRKEGLLKRFLFHSFYIIQSKITKIPLPSNAGTFSIIDRRIVNILNNLPEKNKFFAGLRVWSGFNQSSVTYERQSRHSGKPKSIKSLINFALDGLFSFSYVPLRLASLLGIILSIVSLLGIILVIVLRLFWGWGIIGWASTMISVLFIGAVQLITLGIIGEYLARIYDEVKGRPEYVISEKVGFGNN